MFLLEWIFDWCSGLPRRLVSNVEPYVEGLPLYVARPNESVEDGAWASDDLSRDAKIVALSKSGDQHRDVVPTDGCYGTMSGDS